MTKNKGFSIIEILIAVIIVMILSLVFISYINPQKQLAKGRDAQRKSDISNIQLSLEQYYGVLNHYPDNLESWDKREHEPDRAVNHLYYTDDKDSSIRKTPVPEDPEDGTQYCYQPLQNNSKYYLCAYMELLEENAISSGSVVPQDCINQMGAHDNRNVYCVSNAF